jgi:ketosteroid isomerase-like protein
MPLSDVELIRDHYDATNERDFGRAMSQYAEDVDLVVLDGPGSGIHKGRDAVGAWFGDWFATFDRDAHFEITELNQRDDGRVLLVADLHASGRGSGVEVVGEVIWLYRVRDGKIAHLEGGTTRDVKRKLGLA